MTGGPGDGRRDRRLELLLSLLPERVSAERGGELLAFWNQQRAERRYAGPLGAARFWVRVASDVARMRFAPSGTVGTLGRRRAGFGGGGGSALARDLWGAVRSLGRSPAYTLVAAVTLSLGIGATTAIVSVVNGVLLRPLPYPDSDELVQLSRTSDRGGVGSVAWPDYADWRDGARSFSGMAAYSEAEATLAREDGAERLRGARVTRDLFEVLGVSPALGRTFSVAEDAIDGPLAVLLSDGLWRSRFGGDPSVVGRTVRLDGVAVPVVGVMPDGLGFPYAEVQYWVPLAEERLLRDLGLPIGSRTLGFIDVIGRLDASIEAARAEIFELAARIDEEFGTEGLSVTVAPLRERLVGDTSSTLWFLLGAVVLVLLVACANVAGLSLSRAIRRDRDTAIRAALGASHTRLAWERWSEGLVLCGIAGAAGLGVAWGLTRVLLHLAPSGLPRLSELGFDASTAAIGVGITGLTALLFAGLPALRRNASDLASHLAAGGRGRATAGRSTLRPQRILVASQVAFAVVLLTGAALLVQSFVRLLAVERGFATEGVLTAWLIPSDTRYESPEQIDRYYTAVLEAVRAVPGVIGATATNSPPLASNGLSTAIWPEGVEEVLDTRAWVGTVLIRDGYFEAMGTPLLRGRGFGPEDRLGEPPVAIVSLAMSERLWPGEEAVGKRFRFGGGVSGSSGHFDRAFFPPDPFTVVGVAGDVRRTDLTGADVEYYRPHAQITWRALALVVRTRGDPLSLSPQIRQAVWDVDDSVPLNDVRTMRARVAEATAIPRFRMLLLGAFAALSGVLAMVGLHAVVAFAVARRIPEIGVRIAMGASRADVLRQVITYGLVPVGVGVAVGVTVAFFGSRVLASMLYAVEPTDPVSYAAVAALVSGVAALACLRPARRASRVDPVVALRAD